MGNDIRASSWAEVPFPPGPLTHWAAAGSGERMRRFGAVLGGGGGGGARCGSGDGDGGSHLPPSVGAARAVRAVGLAPRG